MEGYIPIYVYPTNQIEFSHIYGVGAQKLKSYGEIFTKEISNYVQEKGIDLKNKIIYKS